MVKMERSTTRDGKGGDRFEHAARAIAMAERTNEQLRMVAGSSSAMIQVTKNGTKLRSNDTDEILVISKKVQGEREAELKSSRTARVKQHALQKNNGEQSKHSPIVMDQHDHSEHQH